MRRINRYSIEFLSGSFLHEDRLLARVSSGDDPLALSVHRSNPRAKQLYLSMGFQVEASGAMAERMVWYPAAEQMGC